MVQLGSSERLAKIIGNERKKADMEGSEVLCLVTGDMFLGSDYFTYYNGEVSMKLLNILDFDLFALGNHDFDQGGLDNLRKQAKFSPNMEIICANIVYEDGSLPFKPYKIYSRSGIKIAVVSVLGLDAWIVTPLAVKEGLKYKDMTKVVIEIVDEIKSKEKIDFWVCLSHTGETRGDTKLSETGLFDVVFSGHEHFQEIREWTKIDTKTDKRTVCYLHPGNCSGRAVSKLTIEKTNSSMLNIETETIVSDSTIDAFKEDKATSAVKKMLSFYRKEIDKVAGEVIALCHSLDYSKDFIGANFCPFTLTPLSNLVLDAFFHGYKTSSFAKEAQISMDRIVAAFNFGSLRGALPKGDVCVKHVCGAFPFEGDIELVRLEGQILKRIYERNKERSKSRKPGKPPGMGYHLKWHEGSNVSFDELDNEEEYFFLSTRYLRENDISELFDCPKIKKSTLKDRVIWSIANEKDHFEGIRHSLVELVRHRKVLH